MKQWPPKIIVCGHGGHGKDTACAMLEEISGGEWKNGGATSQFIYEEAAHWLSLECRFLIEHKDSYRRELAEIGDKLRRSDPCALIRLAFANGNIINGVRRKEEIEACIKEGLADFYIWVSNRGIKECDPTMTYGISNLPFNRSYLVINEPGDLEYMRDQLFTISASLCGTNKGATP